MWVGRACGGARDQAGRGRGAKAMPVGRMGTPTDIADTALFLMGNPQVTGAIVEVSGGESLVDGLEARP